MSSLPLNTNSWEGDSLIAAVMVFSFVLREPVSDICSRYPDPSVIVLGCRDTPHPFFCYHPETGRLISMKLDNIMSRWRGNFPGERVTPFIFVIAWKLLRRNPLYEWEKAY